MNRNVSGRQPAVTTCMALIPLIGDDMCNLGRKLTVALVFWLGISTVVVVAPARAVGQVDHPAAAVVVQVSGLAGKLVVDLNDQEELPLEGNGSFPFRGELADGAGFRVKIKEIPVNYRCEPRPAAGVAAAGAVTTVEIACRQIGQWSAASSLADATTPVGGASEGPVAAMGNRANGLVVWAQSVGRERRIFKGEYRDGKWQAPSDMIAVSPAGGSAGKPKVALAGNGDAAIVWEQVEQGRSRILLAERRQGVWKLPKSTADSLSLGSKYAWEAEVAMNELGDTVVVWSQESASGAHAIYKSEYRHGKWQHPSGLADSISPAQGGDALRPKVAINDAGATLVVWEQAIDGVNRIFKSEFRDHKWRHPADHNDHLSPKGENTRGAYQPLVAIDAAGAALIAWKQAQGNKERIYLSEYRGGRWRHPESLEQAISPPEIISANLNDLSMDGQGNAMVLWTAFKERKQSLYKSECRQGKWRHPAEGEVLAASPRAWEFYVSGQSAMSDDGRAVAAWLQRDEDKLARAYLAEYDNGMWYVPGTLLNIEYQPASGLALAASPGGDVIVVWTQGDGKNTRLYGRIFRVAKESVQATPSP